MTSFVLWLIAELYPGSAIAQSLSDCCIREEKSETSAAAATTAAAFEDVKGTGLKRKVSSLFKKKPVRSILKKPKEEKRREMEFGSVDNVQSNDAAAGGLPTLKNKHSSHFHHPQGPITIKTFWP